ncbi:MAG: membrane or secreted protein [Flavobacteriaceae bacterium]|nr:membrane or secreted protein [Bacteroidia bacterium]NNL81063.1 membrane or secreted protein [Flavobacteriaceae bacterium]
MISSTQIFLFLLSAFFTICGNSQSLTGAWETVITTDSGEKIRNVVIFSEGFQVSTNYYAETGKFIGTNGGSWDLNGDLITEVVEFDTRDSTNVGNKITFKVKIDDNELSADEFDIIWTRIDDGSPGELQGAWLMSGRIRNGKTQTRDLNRPRKTMKILSGTRFQWIAYNTETGRFSGTGGGTYTTVDGKYTENVEFFSRDDSRAGMSLEFDFELIDGNWHHKGFSSKGDPMHEIWSRRD